MGVVSERKLGCEDVNREHCTRSVQKEGADSRGDKTEGEHLGERCLLGREEGMKEG